MFDFELDWENFERRREVKTETGNTKTGLSMQKPIPRDHQPCDANGTGKAKKSK